MIDILPTYSKIMGLDKYTIMNKFNHCIAMYFERTKKIYLPRIMTFEVTDMKETTEKTKFVLYRIVSNYEDTEKRLEKAITYDSIETFKDAVKYIELVKADAVTEPYYVKDIKEVGNNFLRKLKIDFEYADTMYIYDLPLVGQTSPDFNELLKYFQLVPLSYIDKIETRSMWAGYLYSKHIYKKNYNTDIDYLTDKGIYILRSLERYNYNDAIKSNISEEPLSLYVGRTVIKEKVKEYKMDKLTYYSMPYGYQFLEVVWEYPETFGFRKVNGYLYKPLDSLYAFVIYSSLITNLPEDDLLEVEEMLKPIIKSIPGNSELDKYRFLATTIYEYVSKFGIDANLSKYEYYRLIKRAYSYFKKVYS